MKIGPDALCSMKKEDIEEMQATMFSKMPLLQSDEQLKNTDAEEPVAVHPKRLKKVVEEDSEDSDKMEVEAPKAASASNEEEDDEDDVFW